MNEAAKYESFIRPDWAPPTWLFGPVWSVLYLIIAISFSYVFWLVAKNKVPFKVAIPFIINLISNVAFTPIQFGLQNNYLATADIIIVWITIIWAMMAIWPYAKWVAYAQIPYLIWVSFATYLQITITILNS